MSDEVDYYAVLELPPNADDETIRLAYRRLARRYHPDIAGEESLHRMQTLNEAYRTLSDPLRRREYDLTRPAPAPSAPNPPPASEPAQTTPPPPPPTSPPPQSPRPAEGTGRRTISVNASVGPLRRIAVLDDGEAGAVVSVAMALGGAVAAVGHIDGRITVWRVAEDRIISRLELGKSGQAGTLGEVRISADGALLTAWGFALGLRVWHLADGAVRWWSGMNAPSGLMDAVFLPHPAGLLRLALPDASAALADSDPFRWADSGRTSTAIFTRPLPEHGRIDPAWATPLHCPEADPRRPLPPGSAPWQVRERILSVDGRHLLTFSTGRPEGRPRSQVLHLWEIEAQIRRGGVEPRRIAEITEPDGRLTFPLAATPNLAVVALADFLGNMQVRSLDGRLRLHLATKEVPLEALAALTPDAALLAIAHGHQLDLLETRTGQRLQHWQTDAPLTALAFATAPRPLLALGLPNGQMELWG